MPDDYERKSLSLSNLALLLVLLSLAMPVMAQDPYTACGTAGPLEKDVVDNEPVYWQSCDYSPPSCSRPSPPTVLSSAPEDWTRAQGVVIQGYVPVNLMADLARWSASYEDPATGEIHDLWVHESSEGLDPTNGSGYSVTFGAPGLPENGVLLFKVAFRRALNGKWMCWSQFSTAYQNNEGFLATGPDEPAGMDLLVEDDFHRPATETKADDGAGAGPDAVWDESSALSNSEGLSEIDTDQNSLLMHNNAFAEYNAKTATDPNTFSEVTFKPVTSNDNYNLGLMSRFIDSGSSYKFYQVKVVKTQLSPCAPTIFIINASEASSLGQFEMSLIQSPPAYCLECDDYPVPSTACKQMQTGDPEPDFDVDTVWLRNEVINTGTPLHPRITGTLAWDCDVNDPIDDCAGKFQLVRHDEDDNDTMLEIQGTWALEAHKAGGHEIGLFRAGSEPE